MNFRQILTEVRKFKAQKMALTSKAWIDPSGTIIDVGGCHFEWALANAVKVKAKYGVDVTKAKKDKFGSLDTPVRVMMLNRGFARVSYEQRGGVLTIEANASKWSKGLKSAYFALVVDNLDDIYTVNVNLLDDRGRMVRNGYCRLFAYDDDREKLNNLPLLETRLVQEMIIAAVAEKLLCA